MNDFISRAVGEFVKNKQVVEFLECRCGVGEPRGEHCDCPWEEKWTPKKAEEQLTTLLQEHAKWIEERVLNEFQKRLPDPMNDKEMDKYHCEAAVLYWGNGLRSAILAAFKEITGTP